MRVPLKTTLASWAPSINIIIIIIIINIIIIIITLILQHDQDSYASSPELCIMYLYMLC